MNIKTVARGIRKPVRLQNDDSPVGAEMLPPPIRRPAKRPSVHEDETEASAAEQTMRQQSAAASQRSGEHNHQQQKKKSRPVTASEDFVVGESESSDTVSESVALSSVGNGAARTSVSESADFSVDSSAEVSLIDSMINMHISEHGNSDGAVSSSHRPQAPPIRPSGPSGRGGGGRGPAGAVARPDPNHCPACKVQFTHLHADNSRQQIDTGTTKMSNAREDKVRKAVVKNTTDRYRTIFNVESVLRGVVLDAQLLPLILEMHQYLIEFPCTKHGIPHSKWDLRMLVTHFNEHTFDPIRILLRELKRIEEALTDIHARRIVPDPANPAQRVYDYRSATATHKLASAQHKICEEIVKYQRSKDDNLAQAVFALATAISKNKRESTVSTDPRMAAGTTAVGGDAARTVGKLADAAVGSAYNELAISGY